MKIKYQYFIYSDDEEKRCITGGLNVALKKLANCTSKKDSDEWVGIIKNWFPITIEYYPELKDKVMGIQMSVLEDVEELKDNYIENSKHMTAEVEEVGNAMWWKKTYELLTNFDTEEDLQELEKRIEQRCNMRTFNDFRLILMDNEYSPRRTIFHKPIPSELVNRAFAILNKMKLLSENN